MIVYAVVQGHLMSYMVAVSVSRVMDAYLSIRIVHLQFRW